MLGRLLSLDNYSVIQSTQYLCIFVYTCSQFTNFSTFIFLVPIRANILRTLQLRNVRSLEQFITSLKRYSIINKKLKMISSSICLRGFVFFPSIRIAILHYRSPLHRVVEKQLLIPGFLSEFLETSGLRKFVDLFEKVATNGI